MRECLVWCCVWLAGCSSVLGYDDVSFGDAGPSAGGAASGGAAGGGGGATGGTTASGGGTSSGGAASGGSASGGSPQGGGGSAGGVGGGGGGDPLENYRVKCVEQINAYRATLGLSPYQRWTSAESCTDGEAKSDSETGQAHGAFPSCGESAQNECPGYPSLDATVTTCLAQMWAEGPGADFQKHGHYINMSSKSYGKVACGFYKTAGGSVWAIQNFQ